MKDKKQVYISLLICVFFVICILLVVFYFHNRSHTSINNNALEVRFETSDIIEIKNTLPLSDALGKSLDKDSVSKDVQGYVKFSVHNKTDQTVKYQIYVTQQLKTANSIKDNYIKFYLTDFNNKPVKGFDTNDIPTFYSLETLGDKEDSKLLYQGVLVGTESDDYILRLWLSDSYWKNQDDNNFIVDVDVRVS